MSVIAVVRLEPYRWVTAHRGNTAHLVPISSIDATNPKALCRRRVRDPKAAHGLLCPDCSELATHFNVEVVEWTAID